MKTRAILMLFFVVLCSISSFSQDQTRDFEKAETLFNQGKINEAIEIYNNLIKSNPTNSNYYISLGYAYLNNFDFENAIINYKKAIEIDPKCAKCFSHLARCYYELGDLKTAKTNVDAGFLISDTIAHLYMTRGLIYQKMEKFNDALFDFNKAIKLDPTNADYYIVRANYNMLQGYHYLSITDITKAIELNSTNPEYYYYRAYLFMNLEKLDDALIDINKCIELNGQKADYYNLKSSIYMLKNDYSQAEQNILKSLEINPNDYLAYVNLGDIYFQINDYENYCDCYTKASLNVPQDLAERKQYIETNVSKYCDSKNMPYYFVRALSKYVDANYGECISIAETGLGVVGTSATLSNLKGTANLARGEYEMASLEFLNCLNNKDMLVSEVINYYSTKISAPDAKLVADSYIVKSDLGLAEVFLYLKDPENALLSVNNAIKLADSMSRFEEIEILYNLRAFTYLAKNDVTTAKKEFEFALVKNPNSNYTKLNQALLILLSACKTTPKQYKFIYVAEYHAVRMIMPKLKPLKDQETKLNEALQICNTIIENDPTNAYAYLLKSKISQLLGDVNYCSYAKLAKENGIFNAFEELGISCK